MTPCENTTFLERYLFSCLRMRKLNISTQKRYRIIGRAQICIRPNGV